MTAAARGASRTRSTSGAREPRPLWSVICSGIGQSLITAGIVILLFVAYELWVTGLYTKGRQDALGSDLRNHWSAAPSPPTIPSAAPPSGQPSVQPSDPGLPPPPQGITGPVYPAVKEGGALAFVYIPRFGPGYDYAIVEGTSVADLKEGPGHIVGTALPGQIGNFVVSGHRTTYLAPFNRIDELRPGDPVVFETKDTWYVYRVTGQEIVEPNAWQVTAPVPDHPGAKPTKAEFTFTTCHPKLSAQKRLIVHGTLDKTYAKSALAGALPAELQEGG